MRRARVNVDGIPAGTLEERGGGFVFRYHDEYTGPPVSLTMPLPEREFRYTAFPPFFDGLLPEGVQLEAMLRLNKIDRNDLFAQLVAVGADLVGNVTVEPAG